MNIKNYYEAEAEQELRDDLFWSEHEKDYDVEVIK